MEHVELDDPFKRRLLLGLPQMGLAGLLVASANASGQGVVDAPIDRSALEFWTGQVRKPSKLFEANKVPMGGPAYQPVFSFFDEKRGLVPQALMDTSSLPKNGTSNVSFRVVRFRPSVSTVKLYETAQSGTLRVDLKQTAPLTPLPEALAWTAIAGILRANGKTVPDLTDLRFDPGQKWGSLQKVPITNGLGFWSWNFFLKRKETTWDKVMSLFVRANKDVLPLLGLPGIAVSALNVVDQLFGVMQAETESNWLFQSMDAPVFTTQEGKSLIGSGLPLRTGMYVLVPNASLQELGRIAANVVITDGYLVPKDTKPFDYLAAAAQVMPNTDYLTIYINVS